MYRNKANNEKSIFVLLFAFLIIICFCWIVFESSEDVYVSKKVDIETNIQGCRIFRQEHYPIDCDEDKIYLIQNVSIKKMIKAYYIEFESYNQIQTMFIESGYILKIR